MKKNKLIWSAAAIVVLTAASFSAITAESTPAEDADSNPNHSMKRWVYPKTDKKEISNKEERSVAWYVANTKDAQEQNQECHDNPSIHSTPNCVNSLHALEIIFAGR